MRRLPLFMILCIFTISALVSTAIAQDVLWYGDPNNSVNSNFRRFDSGNAGDNCSNQSNNTSQVSTPNDSEYGKVWRINKPTGQKRGEFARTSYIPQDGQTLFYGWRWKITSNNPINGGVAVWQWKTDAGNQNNTQNYPLNMGYGNGKLTLGAWGPCYPSWNSCSGSISKRKTTLWTKDVAPGNWVSIVLKIKLSRNQSVGYVELWFDGEQQILGNSGFQDYQVNLSSDRKRAYHKTMDGSVVYPKWGSYNSNACNYNINTYYDEMRIATTLAAATPSGSNTAPPSSGADLEGLYLFQNVASGEFLDSNGTTIVTGTNNQGADKRWRLVKTDNGFYNIDSDYAGRGVIESRSSNKEVKGTSIQPSSSRSRYDNREWKPEALGNDLYRFKNRVNGRDYLAAKRNGNEVEYTTWNGNRAQWRLINVATSKAMIENEDDRDDSEVEDRFPEVSIFPSPATSHFTIATGNSKKSEIQIYNMQGQQVYKHTISESHLRIENDGFFKSGLYLVHVIDEKGLSRTVKLIIK